MMTLYMMTNTKKANVFKYLCSFMSDDEIKTELKVINLKLNYAPVAELSEKEFSEKDRERAISFLMWHYRGL